MHKDFQYASYTRRCCSTMVDIIIAFCPIFFILMFMDIYLSPYNTQVIQAIEAIFLVIFYQTIFISSARKATPGGKILKLQVVSGEGERLNFTHALIRAVCVTICGIIFIAIFSYPVVCLVYYLSKLNIYSNDFRYTVQNLGPLLLIFSNLGLMYYILTLINPQKTFYDNISKSYIITN